MSYAQKFKIPLPKPPKGGSNKCPYAILSPSDKKCRRSSQKCEKMSKNHKFFDRRVKTGNHSTVKPMPVCCFYQYASTIAISHWSDFGKVVKCSRWARTDRRTYWPRRLVARFFIALPIAFFRYTDHLSILKQILSKKRCRTVRTKLSHCP